MNNYCFRCGAELEIGRIEAHERLVCPRCGWVYYPQLKVSAGALVEVDGCILLVRRKQEPWKDCWYLPAGYVEADEDPQVAVLRELREETGLLAQVEALFGAYFFDDDPRGKGLLLVYTCRLIGGKLQASDETGLGAYFSADALPEPVTGAGHERALADWFNSHRRFLHG